MQAREHRDRNYRHKGDRLDKGNIWGFLLLNIMVIRDFVMTRKTKTVVGKMPLFLSKVETRQRKVILPNYRLLFFKRKQ